MQSEVAVQINSALLTGGRLFYRDRWPEGIVGLILERNNDIEAIHPATLENDHKRFSACVLLGAGGAHQKARRQPEGQEP